jgi:methylmalonyl-CoA mutase
MDKPLFDDFNPVSEKEWKQKIQVDLKGMDYNEVMITHTDEGIDIKPFYHQDSKIDIEIPSPKNWYITESIYSEEAKNLDAIKSKGTEAFFLEIENTDDIPEEITNTDIPVIFLLNDINPDRITLSPNHILVFDPVNTLIKSGNWGEDQNTDLKKWQGFVDKTHALSIDARIYHNSGANISQQLAYTSAQLQFYLSKLKPVTEPLQINILNAVGTNYFFEIAKLKALRLLVNTICKSFDISYSLKLITEPGLHHMSIYDYNVNMLRSTTECMSAILGGSDFVKNTNYDTIFKNKNQFSQRIARNQLLILKHESYFDKVENVSNGSYYINYLIKALAEKSLDIFKGIEKSGGIIQQLFDGKIQEKINQQLQKTIEQFQSKTLKLIGVNMYINEDDKMSTQIEREIFIKANKRKTLIKPLKPQRIAEVLEQERLKKESV